MSHELVDLVASLLDDAAAVGNPDKARAVTTMLDVLRVASDRRERAITARLEGNISRATHLENLFESGLKVASEILGEEA